MAFHFSAGRFCQIHSLNFFIPAHETVVQHQIHTSQRVTEVTFAPLTLALSQVRKAMC